MSSRTAVMMIGILSFSFLPVPAVLAGDTVKLAVSGERTSEYIEHLASNEMMGRKSCTEGYRKAAEWVASMFREWGLEPAGEDGTYFQKVTVRGFDWNEGIPSLRVGGREFLLDDEDFSLDALSTAGTRVEAEIVFVGYGISAPAKGLDEYAGVDVKGRIVLAFKGSPQKAPEARRMFSRSAPEEPKAEEKDEWVEEAKDSSKVKTAYEQGAAAVLLYDPDPPEEDPRRRYYSSRRSGGGDFKPERDFLGFTIEERVFRAVMKQDPQETRRGMERRIDDLRRSIKDKKAKSFATGVRASLKGYDAAIQYDEEHGNNLARNVLAKIEGSDPELKNEYVIIGAHLDHTGMRNGYVYNGADDNASGSAVVMEVGRVLAKSGFEPKRTVIFCCWCGEELGLLGSNQYVKSPCGGVSMDNVVAYFNMDMVGLGDSIGASGALNFPGIWEVIKRGQDPEIIKAVQPSTGGPGGSDHSPFIAKGIEALAIMTRGGAGHPDYHQPEDDPGKMNPEILRKTGQFVIQGVVNLAGETEVDLLIENREQLYQALRMRISNFNPKLTDSGWSVVAVEEKTREALQEKIIAQALDIIRRGSNQQESSGVSRSVTRGLSDLGVFQGDLRLMSLASEFYGIGRVDIQGDDGAWIVEGRLTDKGREALKAMEERSIAVHLVSPGEDLINDFLSAAAKPFFITGDYTITESMADRVVEKGALLGIDLDPKKVGDFIARLEQTKELIGKRELLVAYLTSAEGLEEAKKPLYMGLIEKGWAHKEICGSRRGRGGVMGGNLSAVFGGGERTRRRGR